jgi:putative tryptophan/tyrosine transport system substrate-binding protein
MIARLLFVCLLCARIALLGTTVLFSAHAQPIPPLVGVLLHGTKSFNTDRLEGFREGMRELGYVEGKTVRFEVRWSDNQMDRLAPLGRELLSLKPDVVVAAPVVSAQALARETKTVPIVMGNGAGALAAGLIASMARPGGNVTGLTNQGDDLTQKHFELLREIAPRVKRVMTLSSGHAVVEADIRSQSRAAAQMYGMTVIEVWADTPEKVRELHARCLKDRCEAIVVLLDPTVASMSPELGKLAAKLKIPSVFFSHEFVRDGGLIAYSVNFRTLFARAATYVDKILKGAKPADLPIEQPTKFELVVNTRTAKALGLKVPNSIIMRADKVIE